MDHADGWQRQTATGVDPCHCLRVHVHGDDDDDGGSNTPLIGIV